MLAIGVSVFLAGLVASRSATCVPGEMAEVLRILELGDDSAEGGHA